MLECRRCRKKAPPALHHVNAHDSRSSEHGKTETLQIASRSVSWWLLKSRWNQAAKKRSAGCRNWGYWKIWKFACKTLLDSWQPFGCFRSLIKKNFATWGYEVRTKVRWISLNDIRWELFHRMLEWWILFHRMMISFSSNDEFFFIEWCILFRRMLALVSVGVIIHSLHRGTGWWRMLVLHSSAAAAYAF